MTLATVRAGGGFVWNGQSFRVALGRGGITSNKREGDGATPAGNLPLRRLLYRADRVLIPRTVVPREPIAPGDGWCDDPADADYNRQIKLPHAASHEALWRYDALYDIVGVLGWNDAPVIRERGSAIFLHAARPDYGITEGCVALALTDLRKVLAEGLTGVEVIP